MKTIRLRGAGLPHVYLANGYKIEETPDGSATTYQDLPGLYKCLGERIAARPGQITGAEFRFLRKQLGLSQGEQGVRVGKGDQAVAKWEKGSQHVPRADGSVLQFMWLAKFKPRQLRGAVLASEIDERGSSPAHLLFMQRGQWHAAPDLEAEAAAMTHAAAPMAVVIQQASQRSSATTFSSLVQAVQPDGAQIGATDKATT